MIEKKLLSLFKRGDVIIIFSILALALALFLGVFAYGRVGESGSRLEVHTPSGVSYYFLSEDSEFEIVSEGYTLCVRISDGAACVESSDCPDRLCSGMGKISRAGESIVCVPARVKLVVWGVGGGGDDAIAG